LGEGEAPFLGVSRKRRREKGREARRFSQCWSWMGWWVCRGCAGLWALTMSLRCLGAGQCLGRLGGGRVRRRGGHKGRRGPTGARGVADSRIRYARGSWFNTWGRRRWSTG